MKPCTWMLCIGMTLLAGTGGAAEPILMAKPVPFADPGKIAAKIKKECEIESQLADYIAEYAREQHHLEINFAAAVQADAHGQVLDVRIEDAVSLGNPFIGHRKSTEVSGKLYRDGQLIGNFTGRRDSMGGAFAGYKGSCSVLGRTVKALGKDIAEWLAAPTLDAQLGDLG